MQRTGIIGNALLLLIGQRQFTQRRAQRGGQTCCCFSRGRRQANTTAFTVRHLNQRRQKPRHRCCFSGPRSAGDHRYTPGERDSSGHFLPVNAFNGRKQRCQRVGQPLFIHLNGVVNFTEKARHRAFVMPHPVQIQTIAVQHQRCGLLATAYRPGGQQAFRPVFGLSRFSEPGA